MVNGKYFTSLITLPTKKKKKMKNEKTFIKKYFTPKQTNILISFPKLRYYHHQLL